MSNLETTDPRILRTRKLLRQSMIELVPQKGYNALTIQDIADHSTLNRTTFYLHYKDKDELLLDVFEHLVVTAIPAPPEEVSADLMEPPQLIQNVLFHVQEYADFYRVMLGEQGVPAFMARVRSFIDEVIKGWLNVVTAGRGKKPVALDIVVNFIGAAYLGVIAWWLENDMPYNEAEMEAQLVRLTGGAIGHAFGIREEDYIRS